MNSPRIDQPKANRAPRGLLSPSRSLSRGGEGLDADLVVAQQAARRGAGTFPVLEGDLAVDDGPAIALRLLDDAPFVGRQVVQDLELPLRRALELAHVVDHHVR